MNFFDHKDLGNHLLQLYPELLKHPVDSIQKDEFSNKQTTLCIFFGFYRLCHVAYRNPELTENVVDIFSDPLEGDRPIAVPVN
jgi:hypothetical protein